MEKIEVMENKKIILSEYSGAAEPLFRNRKPPVRNRKPSYCLVTGASLLA